MALKQEKIDIIETFLIKIEEILSNERSEDYGRCAKMGLRLDPNHPFFLQRNKEAKRLTESISYRQKNKSVRFRTRIWIRFKSVRHMPTSGGHCPLDKIRP